MERDRFLPILQTILHIGEPLDEGKSKVEPFVKELYEQLQFAFQSGKDLSRPIEFVVNLLTYRATDAWTETPKAGLLSRLSVGTAYNLFYDKWYTTCKLVDRMLAMGQYITSTLQVNRVGVSAELKTLSLKHIDSRFYVSPDNTITAAAWNDKKASTPGLFVTTHGSAALVQVKMTEKPSIIHSYNSTINGCDKMDQMLG